MSTGEDPYCSKVQVGIRERCLRDVEGRRPQETVAKMRDGSANLEFFSTTKSFVKRILRNSSISELPLPAQKRSSTPLSCCSRAFSDACGGTFATISAGVDYQSAPYPTPFAGLILSHISKLSEHHSIMPVILLHLQNAERDCAQFTLGGILPVWDDIGAAPREHTRV